MSSLIAVSRRYYERSQRRIPIGDTPEWLNAYLVTHAKELDVQINKLTDEKEKYDKIAYVLYGTDDELESSVLLLLKELGLDVEQQPHGANIDLKAHNTNLNIGFSIEVTATKDIIKKDSRKIGQAWQYLNERTGTSEEKDRLVIVANTQYHLDPQDRKKESFTQEAVNLLKPNGVLMITTTQLYDLWKDIHNKLKSAEAVVQDLYSRCGLFGI